MNDLRVRRVPAFFLNLVPGIHFGHWLRKQFVLDAVSMATLTSEKLLSVKAFTLLFAYACW